MEQRRVLSADPVVAAVTYLEGDAGQDTTSDHFEVTFAGGSETTELTRFTINGDQDNSGGLSDGDMFFDVNDQLPGAGGSHPFQFNALGSVGIIESDIGSVTVSEDGLSLTVEIKDFEAGDKFAFTIDVDEVERFRTDKIASGVEFEGSFFTASFQDAHYDFSDRSIDVDVELDGGFVQSQREGIFYDEYDALFAAGENDANGLIDLQRDNETGQANRTGGALDTYSLAPKPVSISGTVFHDVDLDCVHDGSESGIGGVEIALQQWNESLNAYETVATTTTDADGNYEFGESLGLQPGEYQLVQTQPEGYLDVGADAGTAGGAVLDNASGDGNVISRISIPLGGTTATNYDFCEVRPAALSGHVWHDQNDNGVRDGNEQGIADVMIRVTRTGGLNPNGNDPFADSNPVFVFTDTNGYYSVEQLPPGVYEILEINQYGPQGNDPLRGFIDGQDAVGTVGGTVVGQVSNDRFTDVRLDPSDRGVQYNFGELKPVQISGHVSEATPEGVCLDPAHPDHVGISGVTIELYDAQGSRVATTLTDGNGAYAFADLEPGTYTIVEVQPDGYLDGEQSVGTVNGVAIGTATVNDQFSQITLTSGQEGVNYHFCEHVPAELCGTVYHDRNNNGYQDAGEEGIDGVRVQLFDAAGNLVAERLTDSSGDYCFDQLYPGEYRISEIQPNGFIDGIDQIGVVDGQTRGQTGNDQFTSINLWGGDRGQEYNFGELKSSEISGRVHIDEDGDCVFDADGSEQPLAGVTLELLDADGNVIATTVTNSDGEYRFGNLLPGEYSIRQRQPLGLFNGGQQAGTGGGDASTNLLSAIAVSSGDQLTRYDFCELRPAEIQGQVWEDGPAIETETGESVPGYRDMRDGVFTSGVDQPLAGVKLQLYYFPHANPLASVSGLHPQEVRAMTLRAVTLGDVLGESYGHLGTSDPNAAIWVETNANGEYSFQGLAAGSYIVLEIQPAGYQDANDTAGTTTGNVYNSVDAAGDAPFAVRMNFTVEQIMDSIVDIRVEAGQVSAQNNFSEVRFAERPDNPGPEVPRTPEPWPDLDPRGLPVADPTSLPGLYGSQRTSFATLAGDAPGINVRVGGDASGYSWHLSVINGGQPRGASDGVEQTSVWQTAAYISNQDWSRFDMDDATWTFMTTDIDTGELESLEHGLRFGALGGSALAGDFDGDGIDEVGVFKNGYWMIDLNRNGIWDESDLLVRLGDAGDRPVIGDWDGDGKDDLGIYGPMWEGDWEAINRDPGLPNPENDPYTRPKNVPPVESEATSGTRVMKLTSFGEQRADVVDHVFGVGPETVLPVTGDWNGNGIRSIGEFEDGTWRLDVNGDGRFNSEDAEFKFGQAGDIPQVGDYDGDGVEEIAIFRSGTWMVDSNGNRELDATDKTFELGAAGDQPVTGDWDGDGTDDPGVYREQQTIRFD